MANEQVDPGAGASVKTTTSNKFPPITIPPRTASKPTGERAYFLAFIKAHPALNRGNIPSLIWNAAGRYGGITPTQLAAVLWAESKGDPDASNPSGALGMAQIRDNTAAAANAAGVPFFRANHTISNADKVNPAFAIQYAAWRLSGYATVHGGTIDDIWRNGYGGDQGGTYISQYLPKGYVGTAAPSAPQTAGKSVDTQTVEQGLTNPWVVGVSRKGKLILSDATIAPANAVRYDGQPMTVSDWRSLTRQLESYFVSYTGRRPSNAVVLDYVRSGWSSYSLAVALSKSPHFESSPIYKKSAPQYLAAVQDLLPPGGGVSKELLREAIVNGWDPATLQAVVKKQPGYIESNEFKANTATLLNVHQSIMGIPDAKGLATLKQAAIAGWAPDQYAAFLRSRPEYSSSPEYQTKALSFLTGIGLLTGENPVLRKGVTPDTNPNPSVGPLPTDPRLAPGGGLTRPEDTQATY